MFYFAIPLVVNLFCLYTILWYIAESFQFLQCSALWASIVDVMAVMSVCRGRFIGVKYDLSHCITNDLRSVSYWKPFHSQYLEEYSIYHFWN